VPYAEVAEIVESIVTAYLDLRSGPDELFIETVERLGAEPFKERVYATH
jgi:sulfite reductase (NADPH) hemoprotein beta-component